MTREEAIKRRRGYLSGGQDQNGREYRINTTGPGSHYWTVFLKVCSPSGELLFWQQISKQYLYKRCADRVFFKLMKGA